MTDIECKHCSKFELGYCVRCELEIEMNNCYGCKVAKNKVKKANNIFSDAIVDLICSFNACKRCTKTYEVFRKAPENLTLIEANIWYFVSLNKFPSKSVLNEYLDYKDRLVVYDCSWMMEHFDNYLHYQSWFNELWKNKNVSNKSFEKMLKILRIMFNVNVIGFKKMEYHRIFNTEFFRAELFPFYVKRTKITSTD